MIRLHAAIDPVNFHVTLTRTKRTCNVVYINCVLLCINRSEELERGFSQSLRACNFDRGIDLLIDQRTAC